MAIDDDDITTDSTSSGDGPAGGGANPGGHDGGADGPSDAGEGPADGGANPMPFDDRRATRVELEAERDRLVRLGAVVERVLDAPWGPFEAFAIMMRDPEGNEFCLQ